MGRKRKKQSHLHHETKKSIVGLLFVGLAILFVLASFKNAGPAGNILFLILDKMFGWGYYLLPLITMLLGFFFIATKERKVLGITLVGAVLFIVMGLGLIDLLSPKKAGLVGSFVGALELPFGHIAAIVITSILLIISILLTFNTPLRLWRPTLFKKKQKGIDPIVVAQADEEIHENDGEDYDKDEETEIEDEKDLREEESMATAPDTKPQKTKGVIAPIDGIYVAPPLSLLKTSSEKPTSGDLRATANIIKRTLESFGIPVEMGEINIGPKVTRYTLKPAEGVKLNKIVALNQDLSLALAAHPIRIEAPIPGKSLVGIEVPNKVAAIVRLGSLLGYQKFQEAGQLAFVLGRNVSGEPIFADIEKMPHLLIAGSTGSGKSVTIHSLLISLLYKNSPEFLRMVLIDPKRVELTVYEGIPHLVSPVITVAKKTIGVFKWAIQEMEDRYETLQHAGARDIKSYNKKSKEKMPYIVIVIDELADLMASYGREIEGSIVRLAQMARATGIHLILSTQRPSVEVITGLIKANITSRIALQVASQIDSRTILDMAGAEKLLGGGDLLFISSESSKPQRVQAAYISEDEVKKVSQFVKNENIELVSADLSLEENGENGTPKENLFEDYENDDEDPLYGEAVEIVLETQKASASFLQRRFKIGYARAARLLDIMEANGVVGPGIGAKPREIYKEREDVA